MKTENTFHVAIFHRDGTVEVCAIYGETFFLARARTALADGVEPGDVRIEPPRRYEGGR